jgi:hypothetical protein
MKSDDKTDLESGFIENKSPYDPEIEQDSRKPNQEGLRQRESRLHGQGGYSMFGCGMFSRDFPRE